MPNWRAPRRGAGPEPWAGKRTIECLRPARGGDRPWRRNEPPGGRMARRLSVRPAATQAMGRKGIDPGLRASSRGGLDTGLGGLRAANRRMLNPRIGGRGQSCAGALRTSSMMAISALFAATGHRGMIRGVATLALCPANAPAPCQTGSGPAACRRCSHGPAAGRPGLPFLGQGDHALGLIAQRLGARFGWWFTRLLRNSAGWSADGAGLLRWSAGSPSRGLALVSHRFRGW